MNNLLFKIKYFLKEKIFLFPYLFLSYSLYTSYHRISNGVTEITSNIFGYSLLADVCLFYLYWFTAKYCWLTKISVIGMFIINLMCLTKYTFSLEFYTFWYQVLINTMVLFISIIFKIRKL